MSWTVFVALVAVFQSNQETRQMLSTIDNFDKEIENVMSI